MAALFGTDDVGIQHHLTHSDQPSIANLPAPTNRRKNTADDGLVRNVDFEGVCEVILRFVLSPCHLLSLEPEPSAFDKLAQEPDCVARFVASSAESQFAGTHILAALHSYALRVVIAHNV